MSTTTSVTNIRHLLDLRAYANTFADDYDMGAIHAQFLAELNGALPPGIHVTSSGEVFADMDMADAARAIDWAAVVNGIEVALIFERNDKGLTP